MRRWLGTTAIAATALIAHVAAGANERPSAVPQPVAPSTVGAMAPAVDGVAAGASAPTARKASPAPSREPARVYQQRTAEGGILLTDRPLDEARTERTWAMEREDPDAARARSDRVSAEAQAVSERVQRRLDREQQLRDADAERRQASAAAAADADRRAADADSRYAVGGYWPLANGSRYRPNLTPRADDRPSPRPGRRSTPASLSKASTTVSTSTDRD